MKPFKEALYEAVLFSYGKTLAKYNVFDQETILKNVGREIIEYLANEGYKLKEQGSLEDIKSVITFFVNNGFASSIDVEETDMGERILWHDLYGRDAYAKLQKFSNNPFLSCPLNASAIYVADKYGKTLKLKEKYFSEGSREVSSIEVIADKDDSEHMLNPLVIENARLFDLAEERNNKLEKANKELQILQKKYVNAQKMEAIGTLVGGIAHNFNSMLTGMLGKVYLASIDPGSNKAIKHLDDVQAIGHRAVDMISQLLVFSSDDSVERSSFSLSALYKKTVRLACFGLSDDITVITDITDEELFVFGNANELQQLLLNLINNARDALLDEKEKTIRISLDKKKVETDTYSKTCNICASYAAHLIVEDSGAEIAKQHLEKIYDPFFTTKEVGQGTGLGLSTVYGTVKSHDGDIQVKSEKNKETTFTVCFPLVEEINYDVPFEQIIDTSEMNATVLLVDDNSIIRDIISQILSNLGYHVLLATDREQAIDLFRENLDEINLVLSGFAMSETSDSEILYKMREMKPQLAIILITEDPLDDVQLKLQSDTIKLVEKPINLSELSREICASLLTDTSG